MRRVQPLVQSIIARPSAPAMHPAGLPAETAVAPQEVQNLRELAPPAPEPLLSPFGLVLATVGALAGAYHGTRRNRGSAAWGLAWGLAGAFAPVITTGVAAAQGFGQPQGGSR